MTSRTGAILLHDATLTGFCLHAGGELTLNFEGVTVYRQAGRDVYDIWIHRAVLKVGGVTALSVQGPGWSKGDDDYVLTDAIINDLGQKIHWTDVGVAGVRRIELAIFSGALIEILCATAELRLSRKKELVRLWEGPLITP